MIGLAIKIYADDHGKVFPDNLVQVRRYVHHSVGLFTCPTSGNEPGPFETVDKWTDYVYLQGLTESSAEDAILAYCPAKNHDGEGGNILFADGHVEWFDSEEYDDDGLSFDKVIAKAGEEREQ
jgi:prepilin-type processing-associated H-X9-DG protein